MPEVIGALLKNPVFVLLTLAGTAESMLTGAVTSFSTKFLESQFAITSSHAAAILGALAISGGCGGTFLGGFIVTHYNMRCESIIRMCLCMCIFPWISIFVFRTYCPDPMFAVNIPNVKLGANPFEFPCNKHCECRADAFNPVCSEDGTVFFSPCLAGCASEMSTGGAKVYTDCSCLTKQAQNLLQNGTIVDSQARRQKCATRCTLLPVVTLGLFLALFSTFFNTAPLITAMLRVVDRKDRSLAMAVNWISVRLFGTIPAPLLFGKVIDRSCLVWQSLCGRSGTCLYYNNKLLAHNMFQVLILIKTCATLLYFLALHMFKIRNRDPMDRSKSFPIPGTGS